MNIVEALQNIPNVKIIVHDVHKTICSVRVSVMRMEQITSGSMMFTHPRYLTFGQMVVFTAADIASEQAGALFFTVSSAEEAVAIIENIVDHIPHTKEIPENSNIIEE